MVDLIRNMVVSDKGSARQFLKGPVPSDIGPGTLDRLRRAGAIAAEVDEIAEVAPAPKGKAKTDAGRLVPEHGSGP
ncbi:hypothetical protein EB230_17405 [Mesorhizobium sp. NZP2234]|uniref:hypothetical protein n=1 Tax=Mesorhizobium sp. NZP2234 TaxID=2483402 RepID=UPI001552702B|nr:hypothetical protein [Mesorhizobium sp. NZP2234]QKC89986.1 hypothetical protein EB230_17405 [Mesorhizobium sp. NZP2234]